MNDMTQWCPPPPGWGGPPGCEPVPCPPFPPCPPAPPGPPPWFSPPTPPWYPGANAGVSFGTDYPHNPCRGHFLWDGATLWLWDGVSWQRIGPASGGGTQQTAVVATGLTPPLNPVNGMLWWNGTSMFVWDGTTAMWDPLTSGVSISMQKFTANGVYTPRAGMTYVIIECIGGGGGGGAATAATGFQISAGGGGAGAYSRKLATAAMIGTSQPVLIGVGGTAGTGAGPGSVGGDTSMGSLCLAKGGQGGPGTTGNVVVGGAGGLGTSGVGDITGSGAPGTSGIYPANTNAQNYLASVGGSNIYGGGGTPGPANIDSGHVGAPGNGYGAGGSGAGAYNGTSFAGGAGSPGIIIVMEF